MINIIMVKYHAAPALEGVLRADSLFAAGNNEEARALVEEIIEGNGLEHCSADTATDAYAFISDFLAGETWPLTAGLPEISEVK